MGSQCIITYRNKKKLQKILLFDFRIRWIYFQSYFYILCHLKSSIEGHDLKITGGPLKYIENGRFEVAEFIFEVMIVVTFIHDGPQGAEIWNT